MRFFVLIGLVATACALSAQTALGATPVRIVVAVVDTGVSPARQFTGRLLKGWDFVGNDSNTADQNGHGTELASIVATQCPGCAILPVRVLGQGGLGTVATVILGIHWAVENGANVINLSMTTLSDNPDLTAAIEWAVGRGVTTVLAAGNRGAPIGYPGAMAPGALTVGSVDSAGKLFGWSNYGPWVDVVAPGSLTTRSIDGRLVPAIGTSASAAYVSGAAGLLLGCQRTLTPAEVIVRLEASLAPHLC